MPLFTARWIRLLVGAVVAVAVLIAGGSLLLNRLFPPQRLAALLSEQVQRSTGRDFTIRGPLSIRLLPDIAVVAEGLALGNAAWGSRPEMLTGKRARLAIEWLPLLRGRIVVSRVSVEGADLLLETSRQGLGNWVLPRKSVAPAAPGEAGGGAPLQVDVQSLRLDDALVTWRDGEDGSSQALRVEHCALQPKGDRLSLSAVLWFGSQRWSAAGRTGRIADLASPSDAWPFDLQASTDGAEVSAQGDLRLGATPRTADVQVGAKLTRAEALKPWTKATPPLPLSVQARLVVSGDTLRADPLQVSSAGQAADGRVMVNTGAKPARFDAQLTSKSIDLAPLLAAADSASGSSPTAAGRSEPGETRRWIFPEKPIPFDRLPNAAGTIALHVDRLVAPKAPPITALSARVEMHPGSLRIEPLSFTVAGGQVRAGLNLAGKDRVGVHADTSGLSIDELMRAAGTPGYAKGGTVRASGRLDGAGRTWRAFAAGASGEVLVSVENTTLGSGLSPIGTNLLPRLLHAVTRQPGEPQATHVDCAVMRLPFKAGVARVDRSIAVETDALTASATGEVRLTDETLHLAIHPRPRQQGSPLAVDLASLMVVKGPILDPKLAIDPKGAVGLAAAIGAAGASGGLSLLAERLLQGPTDAHPCRYAATGQASPTGPSPQPSTAPGAPAATPKLPDFLRKLFKKP